MADMGNAYLDASTEEKLYCIASPEFSEDAGRIAIIASALYGQKSSVAAWHTGLALYPKLCGPQHVVP